MEIHDTRFIVPNTIRTVTRDVTPFMPQPRQDLVGGKVIVAAGISGVLETQVQPVVTALPCRGHMKFKKPG